MSELGKGNFLDETIKNLDVQKVVRQLVVESEQKYEILVDNALVGIYIINQTHLLYANPYVRQLLGYDLSDERRTLELSKLIEPGSWKEMQQRTHKRLSGESQAEEYELKLVRKDGKVIDVFVRGVRCTYKGAPAILGTLIETTEINKRKAKLRELDEVLRKAPIAILRIDDSERITFMNRRAAKLFRVEGETLMGTPLAGILESTNPEKAATRLMLDSHKKGYKGNLKMRINGNRSFDAVIRTIPARDKNDKFTGITMFVETKETLSETKRLETSDSAINPMLMISCSSEPYTPR